MTAVLDSILSAPAWVVLGIIALVVFAEDALFVGFVLPGETVAILGGVAASLGHVPLAGGRRRRGRRPRSSATASATRSAATSGPGSWGCACCASAQRRLDEAQDFLARKGGSAVFLGRWVAFFRAVMPALAGTARMPYPKFLAFNAAGGLVWGIAVVLAGYFAGASYAKVEKALGPGAAVVVLVLALVALAVWRVRAHRAERAQRDRHPWARSEPSTPRGTADDTMLD